MSNLSLILDIIRGKTPQVDTRKPYQRMDEETRRKFAQLKYHENLRKYPEGDPVVTLSNGERIPLSELLRRGREPARTGPSTVPAPTVTPTLTPTPTPTPSRKPGIWERLLGSGTATTTKIFAPTPTPTPVPSETPTSTPTPMPTPTSAPISPPTITDDYSYAPLEKEYAEELKVPDEYKDIIEASASWHKIPATLLTGLLKTESRSFNKNARNYNPGNDSWDRGLAQINNRAYPQITDEQADDPAFAIDFAAGRISDLLNKWRNGLYGDPAQAIAVYNRGPWAPLQGIGKEYSKTVWEFAKLPFTSWVEQ